jgi:hypothetical protein
MKASALKTRNYTTLLIITFPERVCSASPTCSSYLKDRGRKKEPTLRKWVTAVLASDKGTSRSNLRSVIVYFYQLAYDGLRLSPKADGPFHKPVDLHPLIS